MRLPAAAATVGALAVAAAYRRPRIEDDLADEVAVVTGGPAAWAADRHRTGQARLSSAAVRA